jgi:hypothetical protein|tara:strand:- start:10637 stop:10972 length:336 start_codon:yes stop_codon:yes gene_type:complete
LLEQDDYSLIEDLQTMGFASEGSEGRSIPLTFLEVQAWSEMSRAYLNSRSSEWLVLLSRIYASQLNAAHGRPATPPPWYDGGFDRSKVGDAVEKMFKGHGNTVTKEPAKET